jgi:predicted nicotinamide N-methyase
LTTDRTPKPQLAAHAMEQLEATLRRRFRIRDTDVAVAGETLRIMHPANADDLISEEDFVRDERLPYWADLWPSSLTLARTLHELIPAPARLLELGCGAGLVSATAAQLGHEVLATDYYLDALDFARVNAWRNASREIAVRHVDWRALPSDLGRFQTILASDVLYETAYAGLIASAIAVSLALGGTAYVADPGRMAVEEFVDASRSLGLTVTQRAKLPYVDGEIKQTIVIWELTPP